METYQALVLAGRRTNRDPLAALQPGRHPALLEIRGVPMLQRVIATLRDSTRIGPIAVSIDVPALLEAGAVGPVDLRHTSLDSPSRSVRDALGRMAGRGPVLVTTADHALLTPAIVEDFLGQADASGADLAVGVVAESVVRADYPETTRTYLRLRDGGFSGANLFAFRTPAAARAAEFWVRAERFRKRPWRLAGVFGPLALLLFAARRLSLDAALDRASAAIGCRICGIRLANAEAAIDVDRPSDFQLVSQILEARGG